MQALVDVDTELELGAPRNVESVQLTMFYAIMMFTLSVRRQEYLMKVIFSGLRCSAVGPTVIRQEIVSEDLVLIGCG